MARFSMNVAILRVLGDGYPWGTLLINVLGSFIMGLLAVRFSQSGAEVSPELRAFLTTGFLGGFTTFSAFSLDFVTLWERGEPYYALAYMAASVIGSVLALFLAVWLVRGLAA